MKDGMVDLHCHFLPAVDDGAEDTATALALVRAAHANGISRIVLTPHLHVGRYENSASSLKKHFEQFRGTVIDEDIPVALALAAEVRFSDEILPLMARGEIPCILGAARVMLLEFPHNQLPVGWQGLLRWLRKRDITVMIAHPERNREIMREPEKLAELVKEGVLVQVTAASLVGGFGERAQLAAEYFLHKGWVSLLATDSHNLAHRPPVLREGGLAAAAIVGESAAWDLVSSVPAKLSSHMFDTVTHNGLALA